jgi:hypothetical protein
LGLLISATGAIEREWPSGMVMSTRQAEWTMERQQLLKEISRLTSPLFMASTREMTAGLLATKKLSQRVAEIEQLMVNSIPESLPDVVAALELGRELARTSCRDLRLLILLANAISGCERLSIRDRERDRGRRAVWRRAKPRSHRPCG